MSWLGNRVNSIIDSITREVIIVLGIGSLLGGGLTAFVTQINQHDVSKPAEIHESTETENLLESQTPEIEKLDVGNQVSTQPSEPNSRCNSLDIAKGEFALVKQAEGSGNNGIVHIHHEPSDESVSRSYLLLGDAVQIKNSEGDWFNVLFHQSKSEGWLRCDRLEIPPSIN